MIKGMHCPVCGQDDVEVYCTTMLKNFYRCHSTEVILVMSPISFQVISPEEEKYLKSKDNGDGTFRL